MNTDTGLSLASVDIWRASLTALAY